MNKLFLLPLVWLFALTPLTAQDAEEGVMLPEPEPQVSIQLRTLDKITARIGELIAPVDEEISFGTLRITARYCRSTPPEEKPETYAYLEVYDVISADERREVYKGWMIASSPAITAMEHAVYDVWVIGCKIEEPEASDGSE